MTGATVVVATRDRPDELRSCLDSLLAQTVAPARIVVVDDNPGGERTPAVVADCAARGPVRYVAGARRGLAAAHNAGLSHADTPHVAFTDDDVVADPAWLERILEAFACARGVGCVTGRIEPFELATPAQELLEAYARFDKGPARRIFDLEDHRLPGPLFPFAAGEFGSGANMAFTRAALLEMGGFDPALGAGTRAKGGDDLAAFFEVLQRGHRLVYEPEAVVAHRHARDLAALERQVYGYGAGLTAYLTRSLVARPRLALAALRGLPAAGRHVLGPGSAKNAALPPDYPRALRRRERLGMLVGPLAYLVSRRDAGRAA